MNICHDFSHAYLECIRTIENVAMQCDRSANAVRLMAVSKTVGIEDIVCMYRAGQRLFGENRVQEAEAKFTSEMCALMPDIELHCIGTLQSNKIKKALKLFACIQSIDSVQLLQEIAKISKIMPSKTIKTRGVFLQVNPLEDPAKCGFRDYNALFTASRYAMEYENFFSVFRVCGLMTIAPFYKDDETRTRQDAERTFAVTRLWKEQLENDMKYKYDLDLSMGMSSDFVCAIREHSTMVRIGSALFGKRIEHTQKD